MEDLAAEIEYIKIKGVSSSTRECKKCNKGIANFQQNRCVTCGPNEYLDDLSASGGECKQCPEGTYSPSNSYGASSCLKKLPCTINDMTYSFESDEGRECNKENTRTKRQIFKYPTTCDTTKGKQLAKEEVVPCRGCTRGQHRDPDTDACVFCGDGEFQDHDNHYGNGAKIK